MPLQTHRFQRCAFTILPRFRDADCILGPPSAGPWKGYYHRYPVDCNCYFLSLFSLTLQVYLAPTRAWIENKNQSAMRSATR